MPFINIDIYPVTGRSLYGERSDAEVIDQLAEGGAKIVQLRDKNLPDRQFMRLALHYRQETRQRGMLLIINDRPDIAREVSANGVHLGQGDMPIAEARKIVGPEMIIGASAHSRDEALEAQRQGADYVNIGPLYETPTKPGVRGIGLQPLAETVKELKIPVSTMGGITFDTLDAALSTGVKHVGVVSALFGADDITAATRQFRRKIRANH